MGKPSDTDWTGLLGLVFGSILVGGLAWMGLESMDREAEAFRWRPPAHPHLVAVEGVFTSETLTLAYRDGYPFRTSTGKTILLGCRASIRFRKPRPPQQDCLASAPTELKGVPVRVEYYEPSYHPGEPSGEFLLINVWRDGRLAFQWPVQFTR
ncbi:MAG: hypothetical protein J7515_20880 [Caulobacter sp.]|nr:hypothetical protein [Caulobacter sp.]